MGRSLRERPLHSCTGRTFRLSVPLSAASDPHLPFSNQNISFSLSERVSWSSPPPQDRTSAWSNAKADSTKVQWFRGLVTPNEHEDQPSNSYRQDAAEQDQFSWHKFSCRL